MEINSNLLDELIYEVAELDIFEGGLTVTDTFEHRTYPVILDKDDGDNPRILIMDQSRFFECSFIFGRKENGVLIRRVKKIDHYKKGELR